MKLTAKTRILVGQLGLLFSILIAAMTLGIIPDHREVARRGRAALCEALAVSSFFYIGRNDFHTLEQLLETVVERNEDLHSIGIRENTGELLVEIGDHNARWEKTTDGKSTDRQVNVALRRNQDQEWGHIEFGYEPLPGGGWLGVVGHPWTRLIAFVLVSAGGLYYFYLGRILKQLNPAKAVPQRVRSALDTLAEGLIVLDNRGQIVLANEAFGAMVERPPDKLVGRPASKFAWGLADPGEQLPWTKAIAEQLPQVNAQVRLQSGSGTERIFIVNCSPVLGNNGRYRGVLVSFDDVTQLEQQRVELAKSKEAAVAANRAKSDFLANMSHEIRTPMNAILGFADILQRDYGLGETDRQKYLGTIHSSGKHLLNLINDILDLSKVESGRLELEKKPCSPHEVISDVVTVLRNRASEKGIQLSFHSPRIPETITTDAGRLRQIITNLVGNAIKFTEQGGVHIVANLLPDSNDPVLAIDIRDSGIGMTDEQAEKIFDPFVQADASVTRRFGGTGLGLAISRRLARALGGDITVTSKLNEGSTFTVTLTTGNLEGIRITDSATLDEERQYLTAPAAVSRDLPPIRILVADDSPANRDLLKLVLSRAGGTIDTAENGQVAIELVARHKYDILLLDMQMPVVDGFAATKTIRQQSEVPILALTADAMKGSEERCMAAGCSAFVPKPIDMDELFRAIKELVGVPVDDGAGSASEIASEVRPRSVAPQARPQLPLSRAARIERGLPEDESNYRELLADFRTQLQQQLDVMIQAVHAGSYDGLAREARSLREQALALGYDLFTETTQKIEVAGKRHVPPDEMRRLVGTLIAKSEQLHGPPPLPAVPTSDAPRKPTPSPLAKTPSRAASKPIRSTLPLDDPDFLEIVSGFVDHLGTQLERMQEAWRLRDLDELARLAHWLKGAGGTLGFDVFTDPAKKLQDAAITGHEEPIQALIDELLQLAARIELPQLTA